MAETAQFGTSLERAQFGTALEIAVFGPEASLRAPQIIASPITPILGKLITHVIR